MCIVVAIVGYFMPYISNSLFQGEVHYGTTRVEPACKGRKISIIESVGGAVVEPIKCVCQKYSNVFHNTSFSKIILIVEKYVLHDNRSARQCISINKSQLNYNK